MSRTPAQERLPLRFRRRTLAVGSMIFAAALLCLPTLPAFAELVQEDVVDQSLQSIVVPALATLPDADERGAFTFSNYTVVQAPVPIATEISSGFGNRSSPCGGCSSDHQGIDLAPGGGYPVSAIADGVVSAVGNPSGALGVYVVVDHVIDGAAVSSVYGHMQIGSMALRVGDPVARGQQLGRVGNTGASTGNHLHFEIRPGGGEAISPHPWLLQHVNI